MTSDPNTPTAADLRRLASDSLITGLCNLIPIPLIDDWTRDLLRKRQTMDLAKAHGVELTALDTKVLACGYRPLSTRGCVKGCLLTAIIKPTRFVVEKIFRKIVRKVLFFLTIKDVVDTVSESFHESYLMRYALTTGALKSPSTPAPAGTGPNPEILAVRRAIEAARDAVDHRPIEKAIGMTIRGSRGIYKQAGRAFGRLVRKERGHSDEQTIYEHLGAQGEARLGSLIDEMTADLEQESSYLRRLEKIFEHRLAGPQTMPPKHNQQGNSDI